MSLPLLNAQDVTVSRGARRILEGLNLNVGEGELWQLVGGNGIGKTSLMRVLAGVTRLGVEGDIGLRETPLFLGHASAIKPLLSAYDNLRWHPSGAVQADRGAVSAALSAVGLEHCGESPVGQLSAGQQRRVALARLWLTQSKLWLLDEPFTAIDVSGARLLEAQLQAHVAGGGSVVFSSHQPNQFSTELRVFDLSEYACD